MHSRRLWLAYFVVMAVLAWLCFGSLRHHLLDTHDAESFADHLLIDQDPSYFFSPDKQLATGRLVADGAKYAVYLVFGNNPAAFHLAVVATHLLASLLLALLIYRLYAAPALAILTGLLFLLNVTHFQAVHWISALDYPLGMTCACAAWLCWESNLRTRAWFFALLMALAVQAHASFAALWLLPLHRLWKTRPDRRTVYTFGATALPVALAVIASVLLASRQASTWHAIREYEAQSAIELILGQIDIMLFLTSRLLSTAHWVTTPIYSRASWEIFLGMAIVVGLIYALYRRQAPFDLGALWILVGLFPYALLTASIIDGLPAGPSRYLYVASAGSSILLAALLNWTVQRQRYVGAALIVAIVASSYVYLKKVEAISLYTSGRSYDARMETDLAIECFERAMQKGSYVIPLQNAYARMGLAMLNYPSKAHELIEKGLYRYPKNVELNIFQRALVSVNGSDDEQARARNQLNALKHTANIAELIGQSYFNLSNGFSDREEWEKVEFCLEQSQHFLPDRLLTLNKLAGAYSIQKRYDKAIDILERIVHLGMADAKTLYPLGLLYGLQKNTTKADSVLARLLELYPDSPEAQKIVKRQNRY